MWRIGFSTASLWGDFGFLLCQLLMGGRVKLDDGSACRGGGQLHSICICSSCSRYASWCTEHHCEVWYNGCGFGGWGSSTNSICEALLDFMKREVLLSIYIYVYMGGIVTAVQPWHTLCSKSDCIHWVLSAVCSALLARPPLCSMHRKSKPLTL